MWRYSIHSLKTTFTLDKLTIQEIEKYIRRLHTNIINEVLTTQSDTKLKKEELLILWEHLIFNKDLCIKISPDIIDKLKHAYHITGTDYTLQKEKLAHVGFTIDEPRRRVILTSAIDNLVKGAAGQAVQNMNIMCGLDEKAGLNLKASALLVAQVM